MNDMRLSGSSEPRINLAAVIFISTTGDSIQKSKKSKAGENMGNQSELFTNLNLGKAWFKYEQLTVLVVFCYDIKMLIYST